MQLFPVLKSNVQLTALTLQFIQLNLVWLSVKAVPKLKTFVLQLSKIAKGKKVHINISEIKHPELDAILVAESIAQQLERRISFRRAMKQSIQRTIRSGAKGIKTAVSGRLGGAEIARQEGYSEGTVPLHTLRADIDYGTAEAAYNLRPYRR